MLCLNGSLCVSRLSRRSRMPSIGVIVTYIIVLLAAAEESKTKNIGGSTDALVDNEGAVHKLFHRRALVLPLRDHDWDNTALAKQSHVAVRSSRPTASHSAFAKHPVPTPFFRIAPSFGKSTSICPNTFEYKESKQALGMIQQVPRSTNIDTESTLDYTRASLARPKPATSVASAAIQARRALDSLVQSQQEGHNISMSRVTVSFPLANPNSQEREVLQNANE
eukprot:gnl/TRDRNA2_/TRDRNA2_71227_c1_seq1.p1 gnl/TRDRNA2_/TRDRNA2_71227_c1~~gnl/TRDRNA2_/TRDRNA2_71227_c1_seq1.p1  ORF type:complete len:223 (-),score=16.67 gnl/TRDRNA2_/TRDRNA2_71227_c1_seq1:222-890(-)